MLGGYELLSSLGHGGSMQAHLARSPRGRTVVVRQLLAKFADDPAMQVALWEEGELLRRLNNYNIRLCLDVVQEPLMQILEHIDGVSAARVIAAHPQGLGTSKALLLVHEVVAGLAFLHSEGIEHHEIFPSNVLVGHNGRVAIIDFTHAHWPKRVTTITLHPVMSDKNQGYIYPERTLGHAITAASDVYRAGLLLQELLSGQEPRLLAPLKPGDTYPGLFPLEQQRPGVPADVAALVAKLLHVDPLQRPKADKALLAELWALYERYSAT